MRVHILHVILLVVLSLLPKASAQSILLFDEFSGSETSRLALESLSLPYVSGTLNTFNSLLANQSWDLVVIEANDEIPVDLPGDPFPLYGSSDWDALKAYVQGGGKAILSFWDGAGDVYTDATFLADFGVNKTFSANFNNATGESITPWITAHPIFNGPGGTLSSPLALTNQNGVDGAFLNPLPGALALGGFQSSPAASGLDEFWAGIILGPDGNTIYNSIALDRIASAGGAELLANEIAFLLQVPEPSSLVLALLGFALLIHTRRRFR